MRLSLNLKSSSKRILTFFLSLALFVGSFVVYGSLLKPEYERVNRLRGELDSKTAFLAKQEEIVSKVQELLMRYEGAKTLQETISFALPANEATAPLFNQVFAIVGNLSRGGPFTLQSFSLGSAPVRAGAAPGRGGRLSKIGTHTINLKAEGSYEALKLFLGAVETNVRLMDVTTLRISPSKAGSFLTYDIAMSSYYQTP